MPMIVPVNTTSDSDYVHIILPLQVAEAEDVEWLAADSFHRLHIRSDGRQQLLELRWDKLSLLFYPQLISNGREGGA